VSLAPHKMGEASPKKLAPLAAKRALQGRRPRRAPVANAPRTRGDCLPGGPFEARPCPFSCRYRLDGPGESCSLDVADRGGESAATVGALLGGLSRQRVEVLERAALARVRVRLAVFTRPST